MAAEAGKCVVAGLDGPVTRYGLDEVGEKYTAQRSSSAMTTLVAVTARRPRRSTGVSTAPRRLVVCL